MRPLARKVLVAGLISGVIVAAPVLLWKKYERDYRLSHVPASLGVAGILYASEESWGFGPGGNETGVLAYVLPDEPAMQVQRQGKAYLENLPLTPFSGDWQGRYERWASTPITDRKDWVEGELSRYGPPSAELKPRLENYLNKYGFGIDVEPAILAQINRAIASPGSFFAYGRIGVIIVVPHERRVFYVYNG